MTNIVHSDTFSCLAFNLGQVSIEKANKWETANLVVTGMFTLTLVLKEDFLSTFFLANMRGNPCCSVLAQILDNDIATDTIINSGDGKKINCHRAVLIAKVPVFEAMFQRSGMTESITNEINMPDLNEAEVRALLGYLYKWDIQPALDKLTTAWNLLKVGNCYLVDDIVGVMREIMMIRRIELFSLDMAVEMLVFAYNIGQDKGSVKKTKKDDLMYSVGDNLSKKAIQVLKW